MPRADNPFFIPMVHSLLGAMGDVAAPELSPREAEPGAMGHVEAPEPTSVEKRGSELRDT
jgi:hypothetical protein